MNGRVLVVDDEKNITLVIEAMLEKAGFETLVFNDGNEALGSIEAEDFDVVITDLYMPGPGGIEILQFCQKNHPQLPVVIITAYGTVESAVSALKQGAFDFITKPFDQTELLNIVRKAVATCRQRMKEPIVLFPGQVLNELQNPVLGSEQGQPSPAAAASSSIIGASSPMQEVFKVISKVAGVPSSVLVLGESGTGKELVAFEIHRNSARAARPFIKINCAAIPATLIESELFGYEKGAFTGAVGSKPGRFELAHEGTLFLDEVAEMPLEMQVKLLRALQEQEFERVGGVSTISVDVRIIAATNKNLEKEVREGRFREDLFYRLNVLPIRLPALRERREDIDLLVRYFLEQFNKEFKKGIAGLTPETLSALRAYQWPGNIRQLENVLERMVLMADGPILQIQDLPEEISLTLKHFPSAPAGPASFKEIIKRQTQNLEKDLIEKALEETQGNVTRAAEKLGLSRKGLQLKIKELGVNPGHASMRGKGDASREREGL